MHARLALLLVAFVGHWSHHAGHATIDRNHAFIGYSESSDGASQGCIAEDIHVGCKQWAVSGECVKNPAFMMSSCALSCEVRCVPPLTRSDDGGAGGQGGVLVLHTSAGKIRINLWDDISPTVAGYFRKFAVDAEIDTGPSRLECKFYRAEAVPVAGAVDSYGGLYSTLHPQHPTP
jgi:hypothetical protein